MSPYAIAAVAWLFWCYCFLGVKIHRSDPIPEQRLRVALAEREAALRAVENGAGDKRRIANAKREVTRRQKAASSERTHWKRFTSELSAGNLKAFWQAGVALVAAFMWAHLYVTVTG